MLFEVKENDRVIAVHPALARPEFGEAATDGPETKASPTRKKGRVASGKPKRSAKPRHKTTTKSKRQASRSPRSKPKKAEARRKSARKR